MITVSDLSTVSDCYSLVYLLRCTGRAPAPEWSSWTSGSPWTPPGSGGRSWTGWISWNVPTGRRRALGRRTRTSTRLPVRQWWRADNGLPAPRKNGQRPRTQRCSGVQNLKKSYKNVKCFFVQFFFFLLSCDVIPEAASPPRSFASSFLRSRTFSSADWSFNGRMESSSSNYTEQTGEIPVSKCTVWNTVQSNLPVWETDSCPDPQQGPKNNKNDSNVMHLNDVTLLFTAVNNILFSLITHITHLLQGQFSELGQRAGQQAHNKRGRSAHDVQHSRGQHGDVSVLPYKGVQERHHRVTTLGEGTTRSKKMYYFLT